MENYTELDEGLSEEQVARAETPPLCKKCGRCQLFKPVMEFRLDNGSKDKLQGYCMPCQKDYRREWYATHPNRIEWRRLQDNPEQRKASQERRKRRAWEMRLEMIAAYGGCCSCCGETHPEFLTLEHKNGGGRAHVRRLHKACNVYKELKSQGWPDSYTCLCFNCNSAKGHFGVCPHVGTGRLSRTA